MIQQQGKRSLEIINEEIEVLRSALNEVVADIEWPKEDTIKLSRRLDELINEYIKSSR